MIATGYGRRLVGAAAPAVTEITCQAWGVRHRVPDARTIIDIGGQDSKVVRLARRRHGGRFRDERPLRRRQRTVSGNARRALGTKFTALESLVTRSRAGHHQQHVRGLRRDRDRRPAGLGGAAGRHPRRRGDGHCHADRLHGGRRWPRRCSLPGAWPWCRAWLRLSAAVLGHPVRIAPQPQCTCALGAALLAAHRAGELPPGRT